MDFNVKTSVLVIRLSKIIYKKNCASLVVTSYYE